RGGTKNNGTLRGHEPGREPRTAEATRLGYRPQHLAAGSNRSVRPAVRLGPSAQMPAAFLVPGLDVLAPLRVVLANLLDLGLCLVGERLELRGLLIVERAHLGRLAGLDELAALLLERADLRLELVPQRLHLRFERIELRVELIAERLDLGVQLRDAGVALRGC